MNQVADYVIIDIPKSRARRVGSVDAGLVDRVPVPTGHRLVRGSLPETDGKLSDWRHNGNRFVYDPEPPIAREVEAAASQLRLTPMQLLYGMVKAGVISRTQLATIRAEAKGATQADIDAALKP